MLRRELIFGAMGLAALGASEGLRPRRRLVLLDKGTIAAAVPAEFGDWLSQDGTLINPSQAGRLSRALYSELVSRIYFHNKTGESVMMLIAYGDTQSDLLQLHRPESCYPAVGFTLKESRAVDLPVGHGAVLPARRVVAAMEDRVESIVYWTRLGERLPQDGGQQRAARLRNAMNGDVPDGALVRFSAVGDVAESFARLDRFIPDLLGAVRNDKLPALVGTTLARRLA